MLPGYNHNIRYGEGIYHLQTEDSGVKHPHVITHLFLGGNIIESRKTSYAGLLRSAERNRTVVELMQRQHKAMLRDLIGGNLDHKIQERSKNAAYLNGPSPLNLSNTGPASSGRVSDPGAQAGSCVEETAQPHGTPPQTQLPPDLPSTTVVAPPPDSPFPPPSSTPQQPPQLPQKSPPAKPPAPDGELFGVDATSQRVDSKTQQDEPILEAATLALAFESDEPSAVDSIFGEDLISEKSLDEVILSYLAEDMKNDP